MGSFPYPIQAAHEQAAGPWRDSPERSPSARTQSPDSFSLFAQPRPASRPALSPGLRRTPGPESRLACSPSRAGLDRSCQSPGELSQLSPPKDPATPDGVLFQPRASRPFADPIEQRPISAPPVLNEQFAPRAERPPCDRGETRHKQFADPGPEALQGLATQPACYTEAAGFAEHGPCPSAPTPNPFHNASPMGYSHVPRSPSPQWDGMVPASAALARQHEYMGAALAAAHPPAACLGPGHAGALQYHAMAQARQGQVPCMPGVPEFRGMPEVAAYMRHVPSLLGPAGYPQPYAPHAWPSCGPWAPPTGLGHGAPPPPGGPADAHSKRAPCPAATGARSANDTKRLGPHAVNLAAGPMDEAGTRRAQADRDGEGRSRGGYKLSQLEEMFATNTFASSVCHIARDQAGCRILQQKLDEGKPEMVQTIFSEVAKHSVELMMDPFGNYLCQKIVDIISLRQLEELLTRVRAELARISINMYGARAVQKLIKAVRAPAHIHVIVQALEGSVVALTKDSNGNHVVQMCLEAFPQEANGFIFRAMAHDIVEVSSHRHGCRIVQRCLDVAQGPSLATLINAITMHTLEFMQDPFANYVVQYVVNMPNDQASKSQIVHQMLGKLGVLSRQKFSSHMVERCLQQCADEDRAKLINELCDPRTIGDMLRDHFGNYVIQSALGVATEAQLQALLGVIRPVLSSLRSNPHWRRIAQKLEKKYPQLCGEAAPLKSFGSAIPQPPQVPQQASSASSAQTVHMLAQQAALGGVPLQPPSQLPRGGITPTPIGPAPAASLLQHVSAAASLPGHAGQVGAPAFQLPQMGHGSTTPPLSDKQGGRRRRDRRQARS